MSEEQTRSPLEQKYILGDELGSGGYGSVRLGTDRVSFAKVAIKSFHVKNLQKHREDVEKHKKEAEMMQKLNHPCIVRLYGIYEQQEPSPRLDLVMELLGGGDLLDCVLVNKRLTEDRAMYIMRQVLAGIEYMHSCQ